MKVYVTGSTRGLGKALAKDFNKARFKVTGLNRPEYDLTKGLDNFVKDDFDIYINNAQLGFSQTELLYMLYDANKDRECHIINIGSVSCDGDRKAVNKYAIEKTALEKACTQLSLVGGKCKVSLVKPGRIDTQMVETTEGAKLDPREVSRAVVWSAIQPRYVNIKSMTIDIIPELK